MKTFVAIAPHAWGQSKKSVAEAVKNCKRNVPRSYLAKGKYPIEVTTIKGKFLQVDGMGRIHYKGSITDPRVVGYIVIR